MLGTGAAADAFGAEAATLWSMPVALVAVALALHPSLSDAALRRG